MISDAIHDAVISGCYIDSAVPVTRAAVAPYILSSFLDYASDSEGFNGIKILCLEFVNHYSYH
jgi:hypothetical protein